MIIYLDTKQKFLDDINNITKIIYASCLDKKINPTLQEIRSWGYSLKQMSEVLKDSKVPDNAGIAIEYVIPNLSKRIDFLISGYSAEEQSSLVIVELKQWEHIEIVKNKDGVLKTFLANKLREVLHPSYQAVSYKNYLMSYCTNIASRNINLMPISYLHNYIDKNQIEDSIFNKIYEVYLEQAPVFTKSDKNNLIKFIEQKIIYGDNGDVINQIENSELKPTKQLQDALASMLEGNPEFTLIDDQKLVFEEIKRLFLISQANNEKTVVIVKGGPGTGKTVLAVMLLNYFISQQKMAKYVSKNAEPRNVYKFKLKNNYKLNVIDSLFTGPNNLHAEKENTYYALIIDESHRLTKKSGFYLNQGNCQTYEAINASLFTIFFIDENQAVSVLDDCNIELIKSSAKKLKAKINTLELSSQFRCNGSEAYINWIDNLLYQTNNEVSSSFIGAYDIKIFDDPNELMLAIKAKNKINNKSRVVAGYCWDWISKNNNNLYDITIYNFKAKWNFKGIEPWAIGKDSVDQIGSIHTSQGLEFDYIGIIIGNDLRFENNTLITDFSKRSSNDKTIRGLKKLSKEDPNKANKRARQIILNTYKTFLTRGQRGCYIYCVDKNLSNYLHNELKKLKA